MRSNFKSLRSDSIRALVRPSVRPLVRPSVRLSVMLLLFCLLGATYAGYMALFVHFLGSGLKGDDVLQDAGLEDYYLAQKNATPYVQVHLF